MWWRWLVYLTALAGSLVFYGCYQEWFSYLLLVVVTLLPWFSLALSLPAMLTVSAHLRCPEKVRVFVPVRTALQTRCAFPVPLMTGRLRLHNPLNGSSCWIKAGDKLPTEHCGCVVVSLDRLAVYDYLGLFAHRLRKGDTATVYIEPKPVPCPLPARLHARAVSLWRPKPGGGFAENHELRPYRPGDDLRSIHWKMTAKTGKLIYREPIEPAQKGYLLSMTLWGNADLLDKKLGQLLWASRVLLQRQQSHEIRCVTGKGVVSFVVENDADLQAGVHQLLCSTPAAADFAEEKQNALWQYHIGGDDHEA